MYGPVYTGKVSTAGGQTQVTTSYRTGRKQDADSEGVSEPTLSLGTFQYLKESDRQSGSTPFGSIDNGHDFHTQNRYFRTSHPEVLIMSNYHDPIPQYRGPLVLDTSYSRLTAYSSPYIDSTPLDTKSYGPAAIRATIPTHPAASLAVGLAELMREGFPHVVNSRTYKEKSGKFRNLGGEYLNTEFGWKPFLKDLLAVGMAVKKSDELIRQFQRDSGRNVRRRHRFPDEVTKTSQVVATNLPQIVTNTSFAASFNDWYGGEFIVGSRGPVVEEVTTTRRCWFSGAYTYTAFGNSSAAESVLGYGQRANALFGSGITPEVVWNLAPWSWLVDWYTNVGTNISNASAFMSDGLVLRYGYLMTETITDHSISANVSTPRKDFGNVTNHYVSHVKDRVHSTPYGFDITQTDLTPRQNAILSALRISFQRR